MNTIGMGQSNFFFQLAVLMITRILYLIVLAVRYPLADWVPVNSDTSTGTGKIYRLTGTVHVKFR